jgi:hypothetical protein
MATPITTSLPTYVQAGQDELISKAALGAKTLDYIRIQTGVKTVAPIHLLDTDVEFGDGSTCGFNEAGSQTMTDRNITTGQIKVNLSYCDKNMLAKWAEHKVKVGVDGELPFEEYFVNGVIEDIKGKLDKAIWQGDTASGDANLNKFDGFLKIASADGSVIKPEVTGNTYQKLRAVKQAIPAAVKENAVIFVGAEVYEAFIDDMVDANLYHYKPEGETGEYTFPGSTVKVVAVNGLNDTNKTLAGDPNKMFYGTDLEGGNEQFKLWFSDDNDMWRIKVNWNSGVQYAFSDEMVYAEL